MFTFTPSSKERARLRSSPEEDLVQVPAPDGAALGGAGGNVAHDEDLLAGLLGLGQLLNEPVQLLVGVVAVEQQPPANTAPSIPASTWSTSADLTGKLFAMR